MKVVLPRTYSSIIRLVSLLARLMGQYGFARWCLSASVTLPVSGHAGGRAADTGGPVVLRPVRVTPFTLLSFISHFCQFGTTPFKSQLLRPRQVGIVLRSARLYVCLYVCLSARLHISKSTCPNFTRFFVHVTCGRGSVLL